MIAILPLLFLALAACSPLPAVQTPAVVDIYQDMESGNDGTLLTSPVIDASSHGNGSWTVTGSMWVSGDNARPLPGPVMVDGVIYAGTGGTHTWAFNDSPRGNYVTTTFPAVHSRVTVACYLTVGPTYLFWNQYDTMTLEGYPAFSVLQMRGEDPGGPYLRAHSRGADGASTFSPDQIAVDAGATYWVNLQYDGPAGKTRVAAFDPGNGFSQVGRTLAADAVANAGILYFSCGRTDEHADDPSPTTQSYFSNIVIDYTTGTFPLLPVGPLGR